MSSSSDRAEILGLAKANGWTLAADRTTGWLTVERGSDRLDFYVDPSTGKLNTEAPLPSKGGGASSVEPTRPESAEAAQDWIAKQLKTPKGL